MTTPREVYNDLIRAHQKASAASKEWNDLNDAIKEREQTYCDNVGLGPITRGDRLSDIKDKAKTLKDVYNKYSFWKGEVERHSAMLVGYAAFNQIEDRASSIK